MVADGNSYDLMIADCTLSIQLGGSRDTSVATAYNDRGVSYHARGDYAHAIADYDTSLTLDGKALVTLMNRAYVFSEMGKHALAIAAFNRVLKVRPEHAKAYNGRGLVYYDMGASDKAIADYIQAIKINPDYAEAFLNRGECWLIPTRQTTGARSPTTIRPSSCGRIMPMLSTIAALPIAV